MRHLYSILLLFAASLLLLSALPAQAFAEEGADTAAETDAEDEAYAQALQLLYQAEFEEAAEAFSALGSYRCSADHLKYCLQRLERGGDPEPGSVLDQAVKSRPIGAGVWYDLPELVVYVPDVIDANTKCVLYFPGGTGLIMDSGIPALFSYSIRSYLEEYEPSALMVFYRHSGSYRFTETLEESYQLLESLAVENGIALHDLVIAGSSNGGYTALSAAACFLTEHGVPTTHVLVYDMGADFAASAFPSDEEYQELARVNTQLVFFDQNNIHYDHPRIHEMTENGVQVQLIYCAKDEHNHITWDGFAKGTISWALGDIDAISEEAYTFAERES